MAYGTNPGERYSYGEVSSEDRREFLKALGVVAGAGAVGATLTDLRAEVSSGATGELAEMGEAIRAGMTGSLDAALLNSELSALAERFEKLPELEAMGVPEAGSSAYAELTEPAWAINEHLADVSFFASAEQNLPAFEPEHIETTTRQLLNIETLPATLSEVGFTEPEQTALVVNIVNTREQLSWWMPTVDYPSAEVAEEGVVHEYVAPLHQRSAEGSLLWIDGLDNFLWQNEVLLTEQMIDRGLWDVKSMLGGYYLMGAAARDLAEGSIADEHLSTLISGSSAIMIIGQEFLIDDVIRITDDKRASIAVSG
ncbi:twin-arginine translocation signal domain-containing protein [Halostagnicola sp. A-GB9-2]|uniref:twin-arginine translocation signal domain-containing protein n=1 Tax=Halostagnicola sp. A-GB9-2 TaxID=3048066 RepID=UPI0024BFD9A3|nr:twin-arginine translocation signal domain-containing protein [Halostagnicola sp. A-GB9-2]MDJ1434144.1 twin-arginine translocation signal domain-containing protein [Halostagnicola sp. A-GB9-2]